MRCLSLFILAKPIHHIHDVSWVITYNGTETLDEILFL